MSPIMDVLKHWESCPKGAFSFQPSTEREVGTIPKIGARSPLNINSQDHRCGRAEYTL